MSNEEIEQLLLKVDKKVDKLLNLMTKIAKSLHLVPVTEKEERAMQIQQRTNLAQAAKINNELDALENKTDSDNSNLGSLIDMIEKASDSEILSDVIGEDYLS